MTEYTIQSTIDLRALDECICGHDRQGHQERSKGCTSCSCNMFSKTVYRYSKLGTPSDGHHDAE